ncbi:ArnT family glycosyltransferase [Alienimonas sp. DA493]|uniref:ArnT family glycosyltransferase n=1 Tax=Alienimonas sp. DA493 TaxID=3373605 RepID=UPI00375463CC
MNPPLVRAAAALPVRLTGGPELDPADLTPGGFAPRPRDRREVELGRRLVRENGRASLDLLRTARWSCVPFSLAGAVCCGLWGRDLYGPAGGLAALALWCLSPMVLGHGSLITPDVPAAALGAGFVYAFRGWLRAPAWSRTLWPGLLCGLAVSAKATWLALAPPVAVALWLLWRAGRTTRSGAAREAAQLLAVGALALGVLHACYGFRHPLPRLGDPEFVSETLAGPADARGPGGTGNRFRGGPAEDLPVPLPRTLLEGLDVQRADFGRARTDPAWEGYLLGEFDAEGWWYFYLAAMLFKTPAGAFVLVGAAAWARLRGRGPAWREEAALLVPAAAVLLLVSSQTGLSLHLRYALPAYPFLFVWAAGGTAAAAGRAARTAAAAGLLALAGASLWAHPHHLGFFNPLARAAGGGDGVLLDSNLDWGQDLPFLADWLEDNPQAAGLRLAYFGGVAPEWLGWRYELPPALPADHADRPAVARPFLGPRPGWYAVSVTFVRGRPMPAPDGRGRFYAVPADAYAYFGRLTPHARPAPSIFVYRLTPERTDRLRADLGLPPWGDRPDHATTADRTAP